ncbi:Ras GTPase-activating-like protein IQGAP2/3 [Sarotherodon galilaeus]
MTIQQYKPNSEVTLSCENVTDDQDKCDRTIWLFTKSNTATITLFEYGKIHQEAKNKSDRLSVTANCSLVIKKLTAEDVGRYICRRFNKSGHQEGSDSVAELSVVNREYFHHDDDTVTLKCSVSTYKECKYTVKWLYGNKDLRTSQSTCSASVTFTTSDHIYTSKNSEMLKCQVAHGGNVQEFIFSQSSGVWKFIVVALGLTVLIMSAFIGIIWKRVKGHKSQMNENAELNLNPAVTLSAPGTIQDSAESEYAVPYSSISYTNNTTSKAQVVGQDDDEDDDTVTYITMKSHIASAAPSSDPSSLYAAVNKPVRDTC